MRKYLLLILFLFPFLSLPAQTEAGYKGTLPGNSGKEMVVGSLEMNVFPNPVVNRRFTIETYDQAIQEIHISNIAGIQVYDRKFITPVNRCEVTIENLPNGIYLLRVRGDGNRSKTIKLLITADR